MTARRIAAIASMLVACDGSRKPPSSIAPVPSESASDPILPPVAPSPTEARLQVQCPIAGEVLGAFDTLRTDNLLSMTDLPKTPCEPGKPVVVSLKPGKWSIYFHVGGWRPKGDASGFPPFGGCVPHPIEVVSGDVQSWSPAETDLSWCPYITHCPIVAVPEKPLFAMLVDRHDASLAGTDRHELGDVAVSAGAIEMELREVEPEITHLAGLHLEVDGRSIAPEGKTMTTLHQGDVWPLRFVVGGADRRVRATLVVSGWYERVDPEP